MRLITLFLFAALALAGCGDKSSSAERSTPAANSQNLVTPAATAAPVKALTLTGAWERSATPPGGQPTYEVLEFFDNGWMILHNAQGGLNAQYTDTGSSLALNGALAMLWPGTIGYRIDGKDLIVDRATMPGMSDHSTWKRVEREPFFKTALKDGDTMPVDVPAFIADMTAAVGRNWRADAIPLTLDAQRLPSGDFAIIVSFTSPSDKSGLRVTMGRWGFLTSQAPNVRWGTHALAPTFVDLPDLMKQAHNAGNTGPIIKASLNVWNEGPAWNVTTLQAGGQSLTKSYSAVTGALLQPEQPAQAAKPTMNESEYIADYNAQWDKIAASFKRARASAGHNGSGDPWFAPSASGEGSEASPTIGGDSCSYSSYAACNAAGHGDTWSADRIENGTSSGSEQSWWDQ